MKSLAIFFIAISLVSCSHNQVELRAKAEKAAAKQGMVSKIYHTKNFNIFTLEKISDPKKTLRIYIEGDGRAYVNKYQPSLDPTPTSNFLINLMAQDSSPNLVYIARPCQFVESKNCEEKYWTGERFSPETISAIDEVVSEFANREIEVVGYSGGAMMALQLRQKNIKNIRTIAGNLDLETFTAIQKISPPKIPEIDYKKLAKIPQIHFIGSEDKIISIANFEAYHMKFRNKNCVKLKVVEGAAHHDNWEKKWAELLQVQPSCH